MDRAMGTREARAVFRGLGRTRCAARTRVVCERMWDVDCLLQIRVFRVRLEASRWQLRWKENVQGRGRQSKVDWEEFKLEKSGACVEGRSVEGCVQ